MLLLLLACAPDVEDSGTLRRSGGDDTGDTGDTGAPPVDGCRATPAAADRDRLALASLPYSTSGDASSAWAVLTLTTDGELVDDGTRVELGRATSGDVAFSPDGTLGVTVHEDGTIGVFLVGDDGGVEVVEAAWTDGFYASRAIVDPSGEAVWVVDGNWANNGGGLYRVPLGCDDGAPGPSERVLGAKLPADLLLDGDRAVLVGLQIEGTADGDDAALLSWGDPPAALGGADLFGDDDAIVSDATLTPDGGHLLVADYSMFSEPNRVAIAAVSDDALTPVDVLDVYDPVALVAWDDVVVVASGYGDELVTLVGSDFSAGPTLGSELPSGLALLTRGDLGGTTLVAEVSGVRVVRIDGEDVEDLGLVSLGGGMAGMAGAVGVQP